MSPGVDLLWPGAEAVAMNDETAKSDEFLYDLLGVVELTYHPAVTVAFLLALDAAVSPVPVITLDPVSVAAAGEGVPVTTLLAGVALVDMCSDAVGVYATAWARGTADE